MLDIKGKTFIGYVAKAYPPGYDKSAIEVCIPGLFPTLGSSYAITPKGLAPGSLKNSNFPSATIVTKKTSLVMPISDSSYAPPSIAKGTQVTVIFLTQQVDSAHLHFIKK